MIIIQTILIQIAVTSRMNVLNPVWISPFSQRPPLHTKTGGTSRHFSSLHKPRKGTPTSALASIQSGISISKTTVRRPRRLLYSRRFVKRNRNREVRGNRNSILQGARWRQIAAICMNLHADTGGYMGIGPTRSGRPKLKFWQLYLSCCGVDHEIAPELGWGRIDRDVTPIWE